MARIASTWIALLLRLALPGISARAQAPPGPLGSKPGVEVQLPPKDTQAKVKVHVTLVNMPVTVRDGRGEMVHNLEALDFKITDNGVAQQVSHFDLGGDPISMVILIETSSRIEPLLPQIRKTGILFTQTVMGPTGEAAVVGFNDSVDKLQDFTTNADLIENTIAQLGQGTFGSKLYEATDAGSEAKLGEVLRQAQLANVTIYSVGLSTTRAELQAKPKDTRPRITPPGIPPMPGPPGTVQTPTSEENRYGNIDLMAAAVWAVKHIHDQVKDHALEVAATATGGAHLATFKDRSIEKAIDEIGGELHSQYTISYTPAGSNAAGYHEIKVNIVRNDAKNLKVRARPGYYLAAPES